MSDKGHSTTEIVRKISPDQVDLDNLESLVELSQRFDSLIEVLEAKDGRRPLALAGRRIGR